MSSSVREHPTHESRLIAKLERDIEVLNNALEAAASRLSDYYEIKKRLDALEAAGVDNWEGYEEAMRS